MSMTRRQRRPEGEILVAGNGTQSFFLFPLFLSLQSLISFDCLFIAYLLAVSRGGECRNVFLVRLLCPLHLHTHDLPFFTLVGAVTAQTELHRPFVARL
jgi:hypothetical protein